MVVVLHSRVVGPLEAYAPGFAVELERQGYTVNTASHQLGLVAHLSRWLANKRLGAVDLSPAVVERYVQVRRAGGIGCSGRTRRWQCCWAISADSV
jgi:integrase/recombinase XerD